MSSLARIDWTLPMCNVHVLADDGDGDFTPPTLLYTAQLNYADCVALVTEMFADALGCNLWPGNKLHDVNTDEFITLGSRVRIDLPDQVQVFDGLEPQFEQYLYYLEVLEIETGPGFLLLASLTRHLAVVGGESFCSPGVWRGRNAPL